MKSILSLVTIAAVGLAAALTGGCGTDERVLNTGSGVSLQGPTSFFPDSTLFDAWVLNEGEAFADIDAALDVTAFEIQPDGHARVYFHDIVTQVNDCVRSFALMEAGSLVFDLGREPGLIYHSPRTATFPLVLLDDPFLGLADDQGRIGLFSRAPVPDSVACPPLTIDAVWSGLPVPHSFGDMLFYQGDLIYNSTAGNIERFDLATEQLIAPLAPTNNRFLLGMQTTTRFWTHCGCGGSPDVFLRDLNSVYDTIHTGNDLGFQITVRAGEYRPDTDRLWLHGVNSSSSSSYFLVINASAEPDILDEVIYFNRSIRGLSFDGTNMWAIVTTLTQSVARLDPNTGRAVESFEIPDEDGSFTGMTFDDSGNMYLLGTVGGQGVIMRSPGQASGAPEI